MDDDAKKLIPPDLPLPGIVEGGREYLSPDEFYGPGIRRTADTPDTYEGAVSVLESPEATATCAEDYPGGDADVIGDDSVAAAGAFTAVFRLSAIPDASPELLAYLAEEPQEDLNAMRGMGSAQLSARFGFSAEQADFIVDALSGLWDALSETAANAAALGLECHWSSVACTAGCADATRMVDGVEQSKAASLVEGVNPSVVPAGAYTSNSSQELANSAAQAAADAALRCVYGNDEEQASCTALHGGTGYAEEDASGNPVVIDYTVPADSFFDLSWDAAQNLAENTAQAAIDCFFWNEEQMEQCDGDVVSPLGQASALITVVVGPSGVAVLREPNAADDGGERGQVIVVLERTISSYESVAAANSTAALLAQGYLDCYWLSDAAQRKCLVFRAGGQEYPGIAGDPYDLEQYTSDTSEDGLVRYYIDVQSDQDACAYLDDAPDLSEIPEGICTPLWRRLSYERVVFPDDSREYSVEVPYGSVKSYVSQDEANTQAGRVADGRLDCYYCNPEIEPLCVPDGVRAGFNPEAGLAADGSVLELPVSRWSYDATMGVPEAIICGEDYPKIAATIVASAATPVRALTHRDTDRACTYGNDEMFFSCVAGSRDGLRVYGAFDEQGRRLRRDGVFEDTTLFSEQSPEDPEDVIPEQYTVYDVLSESSYPEVSRSKQAADIFRIPPGMFSISSESVLSEDEIGDLKVHVNALARNYGYSLLACFLESPETDMECTDLERFKRTDYQLEDYPEMWFNKSDDDGPMMRTIEAAVNHPEVMLASADDLDTIEEPLPSAGYEEYVDGSTFVRAYSTNPAMPETACDLRFFDPALFSAYRTGEWHALSNVAGQAGSIHLARGVVFSERGWRALKTQLDLFADGLMICAFTNEFKISATAADGNGDLHYETTPDLPQGCLDPTTGVPRTYATTGQSSMPSTNPAGIAMFGMPCGSSFRVQSIPAGEIFNQTSRFEAWLEGYRRVYSTACGPYTELYTLSCPEYSYI